MAKNTLKSIGLLVLPLLLNTSLTAQTVTDPVGVVKIEIAAAAAANDPTYSYLSTSMSAELTYQGSVSAGGTGTVTIASEDWTDGQFASDPYYMIIAGGPREGEILDIASNTTDTLTLAGTPATESQIDLIGQTVRIHKHNTIASIFGSDPAAGTVQKGNSNSADLILLYNSNATPPGYETYYYNTEQHNLPPVVAPQFHLGWVNASNLSSDASKTSIPPGDGFIYKRVITSGFDISVSGTVITNQIKVPIIEGYNLVTIPYPVDKSITLASSGFTPGEGETFDINKHLAPGNASEADQVLIYSNGATPGYTTYYVNDESHNLPPAVAPPFHQGWVDASDLSSDASSTVIPAGSAIFVLRKNSRPPFYWTHQSVTP